MRSHRALLEFNENNSACLKKSKEYVPGTAVWLQLAYNAALILIHRPLLRGASDTNRGRFSLTVATTAASTISRTLQGLLTMDGFGALAPQILDYISTAAIMHLLNATSGKSTLGRQSAHGLATCLNALSSMNSSWAQKSTRSIRHIQDLARRWGVVWALPAQYAQPKVSEPELPSIQMTGSSSVCDADAAPSTSSFINDIALNRMAQEFWDSVGAGDQEWLIYSARDSELSFEDLALSDWWLGGGN